MKNLKYLRIFLSIALLLGSFMVVSTTNTIVSAQDDSPGANVREKAACDAEDTSTCVCPPGNNAACTDPAVGTNCTSTNCNIFTKYLNPLINAVAALIGVAAVIGIIWGGIEYSSSGGDAQKVTSGKKHIKTAIIALIGFFFAWSFLQFLIPGGI